MEGIVNVNNYLKMTVGSLCLIMLIICIAFNLTENMDASIYQLLHRTMSSEIIVQYLTMISTVFSPIACLCMVLIILLGLLIYDRCIQSLAHNPFDQQHEPALFKKPAFVLIKKL